MDSFTKAQAALPGLKVREMGERNEKGRYLYTGNRVFLRHSGGQPEEREFGYACHAGHISAFFNLWTGSAACGDNQYPKAEGAPDKG